MWSCAGLLVLAACAGAVTREQLYPHGAQDQRLPRGLEISSPETRLRVPIVFYGESYESIYVNNYGVLSFRTDIPSFLNAEFPLPYPSIAPFYSNIDTTETGAVHFRETDDSLVLRKATESIQNNFREYFEFRPTSVFIATWEEVTYTGSSDNKKNTFQAAIISNGTESFVEFLYPTRDIQWIQKETAPNDLPDAKAQAGFVAEDGRMLLLRGSGSHQVRNIVAWSNVQDPGRYVFRIGHIGHTDNIAVPDLYNQYDLEYAEESKTCAQSGPSVCHTQARCVDYQAGICCQCNEGFYGNGKSCVRNDAPLRVHGKLSGIVNEITLNDVDVQAYVVVADGRTYTALSQVPSALGNSLQLVNVLGGVIGWLFAKPYGGANNGYQLTGAVFNHTADIYFPATGNQVTLNQEFGGHDVFDQISLESDLRGTLPPIEFGAVLQITEYQEQYTVITPGLIRSESTRTLTNKRTGATLEQRVSQTISYNPCHNAPTSPEDLITSTLKVGKNYIGYEATSNIVRYGMSNRVTPLGQEDPCIAGRSTCGHRSSCVVKGDTFACVCPAGFSIIQQNNQIACIDVDECIAGIHNCDSNADCYNYDGGFECRCRTGFEGDGISCNRVSQCRDTTCNQYAQCIESYNVGEAACVCNPGYTGDGQRCWLISAFTCDVLQNCSPYASCIFSEVSNSHICQCIAGYVGDGFYCSVEENAYTPILPALTTTPPPPTTPPIPTTPPPPPTTPPTPTTPPPTPATTSLPTQEDTEEVDNNETFVLPHCNQDRCECPQGYSYFRDERNNNLCRINGYNSQSSSRENNDTGLADIRCTDDENCPANSVCTLSYSDFASHCVCSEGYEAEANYCVQRNSQPEPEPVSVRNDTSLTCSTEEDCPPNAVCSVTTLDPITGQYVSHCVCPEGYGGDDPYECMEQTTSACACGPNAHCYNTGSGEICVCDPSYHGDGYTCRPKIICTNHSECESHAECRLDSASNEFICQCEEGYVKDENEACILDRLLCNGGMCAEHASCVYDESIPINYCQCDPGYTGDGITQCLVQGATCDVTHDCSENGVCTLVGDAYQCICKDDFIGDGYFCRPEPSCRTDPSMCDENASCIKRNEVYICECNSGYSESAEVSGRRCVPNRRPTGNFLVASDGVFVYKVPFQASARDFTAPINSGIDQIAVGIDTDCQAGRVYWGDVVSNAIKSTNYDGSSYELFISDSIKAPEGVAIDWSARNIFWTDSKKLSIEVANLDTKVRKTLFNDSLSNPRGIAVHPSRGKVFWSDWNRASPKIEWSNMDGTQRGVFVDSSEVILPNSLAIDWVRDRLCYADAGLHSIKCVHPDTMERETIATNCQYPFGLAINGDMFYWTDWKTQKLENIDTRTQTRGFVPISIAPRRLYGVAVAPDQCPATTNVCQYRNGNCGPDQLCLPGGSGVRTCVAGDNFYRY